MWKSNLSLRNQFTLSANQIMSAAEGSTCQGWSSPRRMSCHITWTWSHGSSMPQVWHGLTCHCTQKLLKSVAKKKWVTSYTQIFKNTFAISMFGRLHAVPLTFAGSKWWPTYHFGFGKALKKFAHRWGTTRYPPPLVHNRPNPPNEGENCEWWWLQSLDLL